MENACSILKGPLGEALLRDVSALLDLWIIAMIDERARERRMKAAYHQRSVERIEIV